MPLSLAHVLEHAAAVHADRPAVQAPGAAPRSYRDVARAAARVARALHAAGVRRGDRVGLLIPKSVESVTAVWGVLMAGAAYVPIDPSAPPQRAAFIGVNCEMAAVIASSDLAPQLEAIVAALPDIPVFFVHGSARTATPGACIDLWATTPPWIGVSPAAVNVRDLAYILYTSGSTGTPKGVMVSHGAALSFPEWGARQFKLDANDRVSSHAPLHFDLSTFDIFATALAGACVVVLDDETVRFPMAAAAVMSGERISVWYSVPGALRSMLRFGQLARRDLSALRVVLFAGEVYPAEELAALQRALPHVQLANLYGPTETNVCTWWEVPPPGAWTTPLIGAPCENCEACVVDESLRPVPDGTPGELLIRGGTLMEGYWGDPERTARSFLPNVLHPHLGDRFYRTGDLVSLQANGMFAFHGRRDHMVKVRGYRVELGEVEAALHSAPGVTVAAVVTRSVDTGTDLVAFLEKNGEDDVRSLTVSVRRHLTDRLPKYMIPADFRWLPRMPLTSTGKVDRQALTASLE